MKMIYLEDRRDVTQRKITFSFFFSFNVSFRNNFAVDPDGSLLLNTHKDKMNCDCLSAAEGRIFIHFCQENGSK